MLRPVVRRCPAPLGAGRGCPFPASIEAQPRRRRPSMSAVLAPANRLPADRFSHSVTDSTTSIFPLRPEILTRDSWRANHKIRQNADSAHVATAWTGFSRILTGIQPGGPSSAASQRGPPRFHLTTISRPSPRHALQACWNMSVRPGWATGACMDVASGCMDGAGLMKAGRPAV